MEITLFVVILVVALYLILGLWFAGEELKQVRRRNIGAKRPFPYWLAWFFWPMLMFDVTFGMPED